MSVFIPAAASGQTSSKPPVQRVRVTLAEERYQPESFRLRRGIRAYITFLRTSNRNCGEEILIPKYGIHRNLPVNKPVTVWFVPRESGSFAFTCGMDMIRGTIIVN
ncbi:MAG: cupredoxin domain-containing protein [Pyrinomonadaceae bacterium]